MITAPILRSLYPATSHDQINAIVDPINKAMEKFDISTPTRVAAFISQAGHESGGFSVMHENLNYSAKGLRGVFGKYFPTETMAEAYQHQPQKIASRVYANRMGNGDEASGEGYLYRGRGFIQLTGKGNYQAFANSFGMKLAEAVAYLETLNGAALSATWFWDNHKLNQFADHGLFTKITQVINGGQNGAPDREAHYALAKKLLVA